MTKLYESNATMRKLRDAPKVVVPNKVKDEEDSENEDDSGDEEDCVNAL